MQGVHLARRAQRALARHHHARHQHAEAHDGTNPLHLRVVVDWKAPPTSYMV